MVVIIPLSFIQSRLVYTMLFELAVIPRFGRFQPVVEVCCADGDVHFCNPHILDRGGTRCLHPFPTIYPIYPGWAFCICEVDIEEDLGSCPWTFLKQRYGSNERVRRWFKLESGPGAMQFPFTSIVTMVRLLCIETGVEPMTLLTKPDRAWRWRRIE